MRQWLTEFLDAVGRVVCTRSPKLARTVTFGIPILGIVGGLFAGAVGGHTGVKVFCGVSLVMLFGMLLAGVRYQILYAEQKKQGDGY